MSKSADLRAKDWHAIIRIGNECRDLGDDPKAWRQHLLASAARLVDADLGFSGEMTGVLNGGLHDLGFTDWGYEHGFDRQSQLEAYARVSADPSIYGVFNAYLERMAEDDGACVSSRDVADPGSWRETTSYQLIHRPLGVDHSLWCFRSFGAASDDVFSGLMLQRAIGRRDFSLRDRTLVHELQRMLVSWIGGPLARFTEPSPRDLPRMARRVLSCLLEGEGDKQVAARLGLRPYTVNEYTKRIYGHFGVQGRSELLARWVRRGMPATPSWIEDKPPRQSGHAAPPPSLIDAGC